MKKVICIVLAIIFIFFNVIAISADNFSQHSIILTKELSDLIVDGTPHWAKGLIDKLVERGIIAGYPDGTFRPNNTVEADSFIKMVICALGHNFENGNDYWAMPFIDKAKELKLIDGTEFDTYRRIITREEASKIIINALATKEQLPSEEQINKYITKVPDYSKIGANYKKVVLYAYATGMITGNERGYFNPKSNLSRAEAATVIIRLLDASLRKPVDIEDELNNPIHELLKTDAEVWMLNDVNTASEMTNIDRDYELRDGKLYFKNKSDWTNVLPKTTINSDINGQIHDVTKVMISKNHYVPTFYVPAIGDLTSVINVALSKSEGYFKNSSYFFGFTFYEGKHAAITGLNKNFSSSATIKLTLNQLWWERNEDGTYWNPIVEGWSTPFYADKLKKSCMALFGTETGEKIYEYVHSVYMDERTKQNSQKQRFKTTTIDNIQVDFYNEAAQLYFYFTVKK